MREYTRAILTPLALSLVLALGACGGDRASEDSAAVDSALNRDLDLANRDTTTPTPSDAPRAGGGSTRPPASRPSGGGTTPRPPATTPSGNTVTTPAGGRAGETTGTVSAGTSLQLASSDRVCTNTHKAGDRFIATVSNTVTGSNGVTIPAGSRVVIQVTAVQRSGNANEAAVLKFNPISVEVRGKVYPIKAEITSAATVQGERSGKDAQKVATGAAIGAIAGQILGKDTKSTVIGGAIGAAAGTAVAVATANYEGCVPQGGNITISLTEAAAIGIAE